MVYNYSFLQWIFIFYAYCFLGWCFESAVVSVEQRRLVNRGFLRGPMLPIYGCGAVLLLHVSLPLYDRPVELFFASMLAATVFGGGIVVLLILLMELLPLYSQLFQRRRAAGSVVKLFRGQKENKRVTMKVQNS